MLQEQRQRQALLACSQSQARSSLCWRGIWASRARKRSLMWKSSSKILQRELMATMYVVCVCMCVFLWLQAVSSMFLIHSM